MRADVIIIGGGIVGLATGYDLTRRYPHKKVILLEKEARVAAHQTGRNSGVLHSGIYYKPGSLKAATCREGKRLMEEFCERHQINYEICGKVIVAVDESELQRLEDIYERGKANQINCEMIERSRLSEIEPHAAGLKAIHVREAGIVDYCEVSHCLAHLIMEREGRVITGAEVRAIKENDTGVIVRTTRGDFSSRVVVNCAGLQSDKVARMAGADPPARIIPFRGEYFKLRPEAASLCNNLIYPVPDPRFPFLGVHFTRKLDGSVECGPGAIVAFAREGYRKTDVKYSDLIETVAYRGFLRLAARYWKTGAAEMWQSLSKSAFARALQRLVPELSEDDLVAAPSGVRAQAVAPDGALVDDFAFHEQPHVLNVINAPSPAATASLSIGRVVVERLATRF